ncbi:isochorismatase family cysteine hydrolase [Anaeromicrobium sediminis]|uniref:Isochorismatase-like domain-containing protein n=1 Tax=Anaeromicrobium sediminis TaxID=1478221 RepID=A0A267MP76_9FIRM|nr:isochorismatase family cysteine hydrolase [Anaeromicrobium sediminis]PAB60698.1 hypothetical protein CCE28_03935 [Anaeromicrobium sediminis]
MNLQHSALIIIDVQKGFINENTKHIPGKITDLIEKVKFEHIIQTRFINKPDSPYVNILNWTGLLTREEISFPNGLKLNNSLIIDKYYYSACTKEFLDYIAKKKIKQFFLVGINTDICVLKTAVDLFELNYRSYVLTEYCGSTSGQKSHEAGLFILRRFIGDKQIITNSEKYFNI